jgi:hypothetical protein
MFIFTLVLCCLSSGCGKNGLETKVVYGTVKVGGEPVPFGQVMFVPIDDTPGPSGFSTIQEGSYRVEARGGVPLGTHRVEVIAERKTGKQIPGREGTLVDEKARMGPPIYATEESPLRFTVSKKESGEFNIEFPVE